MIGFQANHLCRRRADLESVSGAIWVTWSPAFSRLAVRVKAKSCVTQNWLLDGDDTVPSGSLEVWSFAQKNKSRWILWTQKEGLSITPGDNKRSWTSAPSYDREIISCFSHKEIKLGHLYVLVLAELRGSKWEQTDLTLEESQTHVEALDTQPPVLSGEHQPAWGEWDPGPSRCRTTSVSSWQLSQYVLLVILCLQDA